MVQCNRESLILGTAADKAVNADKERDTAADKELNAAVDEAVDADKGRDVAAEPSMLIKDQITRRTRLAGWIGVG